MPETITIRLDPDTRRELQELVEHFERDELGRLTRSRSSIARAAVHRMHEQILGPGAPRRRQARRP